MIVEEGKYYRSENGKKIGPMSWWDQNRGLFTWWKDSASGLWKEDGSPHFTGMSDTPRLIAEWTDEPDLTAKPDYNDGKWHGWNGGECPVDPEAEIEAAFTTESAHQPLLHRVGLARDINFRWLTISDVRMVAFRVIRPAAPQPEPLADRLQRILTDGLTVANNEGATLLKALDLWAAERGVTIKEG